MDSTNGSHGAQAPPWTHTFGEPPPPPATARGTLVTLADGHEWRIPAFNFYDLQVHQSVAARALTDINWTKAEAREAAIDLARLAMARNYPGITREALAQLLDFEAAAEVMKVVWVQNGFKLRDLLTFMGLDPPAGPMLLQPIGAASTDG